MGRHRAPAHPAARRILGASLAAGALTVGAPGLAYAGGGHGHHDPDTAVCGEMENGDALIAAPVCAPIFAPDLLDADLVDDVLNVGDLLD